ncbi:MAG: glutamine synthetase [Elusimicrobia bacterium]|nr:glutamine synthetase [Elusimicrobiota bacterium]
MSGKISLKELAAQIRKDEIDTVLAVFPDMQGRWMGKRVTGRYFLDNVMESGLHACAYLLATDVDMEPLPGFEFASWQTGYQDFHMLPDWGTLRMIPWLEKTALVVCDAAAENGAPVSIAPRSILKRQIERAAQKGLRLKVASELEFFLFKETYETAQQKNYHGLEPFGHYIEDYHVLQGSKEEFLMRAIRTQMEAAGVPVEFSKGEWGKGQHEINLRCADPLEMADRHSIYKTGVKEIAMSKGLAVTFMAKYDGRQAGSSFHLHASLWDASGKKALFWNAAKKSPSPLFSHFLAGQMALAREFSYFFAPHVNSYKRYQSGSFAPTRIAWGRDNRTCGFRIVGEEENYRIENRIPGADANPYLAFAAAIAAGLYGLERKLPLAGETRGNAYLAEGVADVPKSLAEAVELLRQSSRAREAFGPEVVEHYLRSAGLEQASFDAAVTCWEREKFFERI